MNPIQDKFEDEINSKSSPVSRLYFFGIALTVIYLIVIVFYAWLKWNDFIDLKPNEFGDFLAGAFAPLAFAWLILGFFQQGYELRQNSTALRLQVEELRSAASHAGAMVDLQRQDIDMRINDSKKSHQELQAAKQAELELKNKRKINDDKRKAQPNFNFPLSKISTAYVMNSHLMWRFYLENTGARCTNIFLRTITNDYCQSEFAIHLGASISILDKRAIEEITLHGPVDTTLSIGKIVIDFVDNLGENGQQIFTFRINHSNIELIKED